MPVSAELAALLADAQSAAASLMTDTCVIERRTGETTDPNTGVVTPTWTTVLDASPCRIQRTGQATLVDGQVGEQVLARERATLQLPADTDTTAVDIDDVARITASETTSPLVGTRWRIAGIATKTHQSMVRLQLETLPPWG